MVLYCILLPIIWLIWHVLWRIQVTGREYLIGDQAGRGYVVASNHISDIDPVFIGISIFSWKRVCILAKQELFRNPFIGWFLGLLGAVPVARGKADTQALDRVTQLVEQGHGMLIFPEGTRTRDGRIGKIKSGAFVVASAAGADMIPCRIIYDTPNGRMRPFCRVRVCFGPHIPAADLHIEDPRRSIAQIRELKTRLNRSWDALYAANRFPGSPTLEQLNGGGKSGAAPAAPAADPRPGKPADSASAEPVSRSALELPRMELPKVELDPGETQAEA